MMKFRNMFSIVTAAILTIIFCVNGYGYIKLNGSGSGYDGGDESTARTGGDIEAYIIDGAGYFLDAHSDTQTLLRLVELKDVRGLDMDEFNGVLDGAAANINKAVEVYGKLVGTAERTPYNEVVLERLNAFDYKGFMEDNGLNTAIFGEVEMFLGQGDITGVFKKTYGGCKVIAELLKEMRDDVRSGKGPDVSICRRLNESFAEMSLFGSYVARVFEALL